MFKSIYASRLSMLIGLAILLFAGNLSAQVFQAKPLPAERPALDEFFTQYEVFEFDATALKNWLLDQPNRSAETRLVFGQNHFWKMNLAPSFLMKPGISAAIATEKGIFEQEITYDPTYHGALSDGGGRVSLVINDDWIEGAIEVNGQFQNIQPLFIFDKTAAPNQFVVYADAAIKETAPHICGTHEAAQKADDLKTFDTGNDIAESSVVACYQVDLAVATASTMNNFYGGTTNVQNHVLAVLALVNSVYAGNFNHDIVFNVTDWHNSTSSAMDGWGQTPNANQLLNNFTNWGQAGNFGSVYDLAQLWDHTTWQGGVAGIAWVGAVCTSVRYSAISDWTANMCLLKVTTAHEFGHNFNCNHDGNGSPFIMAPVVNCTDDWSNASITSVNNYLPSKINANCLTACSGVPAPVADFTWSPSNPACTGESIFFDDLSTNSPVSWSWTFPGGSPATSTQQNPIVTWANAGTYNVTLVATNPGGSSTKTKAVIITAKAVANFTFTKTLNVVNFTSSSQNALTHDWDFGDGNVSTLINPTHTYAMDGTYLVSLTVTNSCGASIKSVDIIIITPPIANFSADPTSGCATLGVQFINLSSPNATSFAWNMPGAIPAFSTLTAPMVAYVNPGMYSVTLTAYNPGFNDQEIKINFIQVQTVPNPSFTSVINGSVVAFTNTTSGGTSYLWDFGDGQTSTLISPTHTYSSGGTFTVTLTATNVCGNTSTTQIIVIAAAPVASFTAAPTSGCAPLTVNFTNTSVGGTSWNWTFAGGTPGTSTDQNPTVVYNTPGTYSVTLTATNNIGSNTVVNPDFIVVGTTAVPGFTSSVNLLVATFTNTSVGATSYLWNFGDGMTSTEVNPVHTYAADGTYNVVLSAINACGTTTYNSSVAIVTPVSAGFSGSPTSGCQGLNVQFTSLSSPNVTGWNWQFAGGSPATSTAQNPSVVYQNAGTYGVTLTVSNSGYSSTATQTSYITVNPTALAGFTASSVGNTVTFTNTSQNATTYSWAFGDGNNSAATNPVHTYAADGTYSVTLTATNACGTTTSVQSISLNTPPTAAFTASTTSGCEDLTVNFTNQSSANASSFDWQFPGGNPASSTAQNPTVIYENAGVFNVTLTVTNAAGSSTSSTTITVGTTPTTLFSTAISGRNATFTNGSSGANSYAWNFGDGQTSTDQNPVHVYDADGSYTIVLTSTNNCGSTTYTQTVVISTPPTAGFSASATAGCGPLTVQFTNSSSANSATFDWQFPGGNPASSTEQNPTVNYSSPGTYTASLTVSNGAGSNTTSTTIQVNPTASANFTSQSAGLTTTFTNTSQNSTSWFWNFGDGQTSTDENPVHVYPMDGTWTTTLTAVNGCGSTIYTQIFTVTTPPSAGFTTSLTEGCGPLTVNFMNTSSANSATFDWQFPGGSPASSTDQNPTVNYATPGIFSASLTVTNAAGSSTTSTTIQVNPMPSASFLSQSVLLTTTFQNTSQNGVYYAWDFGDGQFAFEENPTHTYGTDGTYTVLLTATNGCGSTNYIQTIVVITPPVAGFSASQTTGCAPVGIQFTNSSSPNSTSYEWTFSGGNPGTSTDKTPTSTWVLPGTYEVVLTATNAAGSSTSTQILNIGLAPSALFTWQTAGLEIVLSNNSAGIGNSYSWNFGDSQTSTDENPTHVYSSVGNYVVNLTVTNPCGTATVSIEIQISGTPPIPAISAAPLVGCAPLEVQFTDQSAGSPTSWLWSFTGGSPATSTLQNPLVTYSVPGVYDVSLKVSNIFGEATATFTGEVEVATPPTVGFVWNAAAGQFDVQFTNLTSNSISFNWNFGDGTTSTEQNPLHTFPGLGSYTVSLTASNACQSNTVQQTVVLIIGTGEADWLSKFLVYPNPTDGLFTIELEGQPFGSLTFSVLDILGRQVIENQAVDFSGGSLKKTFDLTTLPAASYFVRLQTGEKTAFLKVVKQ